MYSSLIKSIKRRAPQSFDEWAALVLLIVGPAYLFLRHFHIQILNPKNIYWLMQHDWGQHALGLHAYLHSDWDFPLTRTDAFFPPEGAAAALTDSNPLVAVPLKLFAWALPDDFQIIGLWLALCICLQVWIGYLLLRPAAKLRWIAALAALGFALWPPLYFRMDHDTLVAQWILLLGMLVYLSPASPAQRLVRFSALLMLSASIHAMLFLMVCAYLSAEIVRSSWKTARRREDWRYPASIAIIPPASAIGVFFLIGTLPGGTGGSWGFGEYSMNLNSPVNPMTEWGSTFLPPLDAATYQYEGFAYFGVGLLALFVVAAGLFAVRKIARPTTTTFSMRQSPSLLWLTPAMIGYLLLALSTTIRLGENVLLDIHLSQHVREDLLGPVRASGRFFWPAAYLLIFIALREVLQLPIMRAAPLLCVLFTVQLIDLRTYSAAEKNRTGLADEISDFRKAASPEWDALLAHSDHVVFLPPNLPTDKTFFYELAWRAINHDATINTMYMSRLNDAQRHAKKLSVETWLRLGPQSRTLYVFLNGCSPLTRGRDNLRRLDGVLILPPSEPFNTLNLSSEETCR